VSIKNPWRGGVLKETFLTFLAKDMKIEVYMCIKNEPKLNKNQKIDGKESLSHQAIGPKS